MGLLDTLISIAGSVASAISNSSSGSGSGNSSSGGGSTGGGYSYSSGMTGLSSMSDSELRDRAASNSAAWYGADSGTQNALHNENVEINRILDARNGSTTSYDSASGTWSSSPKTTYGPSTTYSAGDYGHDTSDYVSGLVRNPDTGAVYSQTGKNMTGYKMADWANDKTDYAANALQSTSIDEIQSWLASRSQKAAAQGIDISGNNSNYQSNDDIYNQWWDSRGKYIPESFNYGGSQKGTGFYGEDSEGNFGYFADPERTIKLENGGWDKSFRSGSTQVSGSNNAKSTAGASGGGAGYSGGGYSYSNGYGYGGQPTYNSAYANDIAALTRSLLNRDPFSYDLNKDPLYGYYANTYERNGQRAMKDTLGQVAARTGGMASSWAGSQAQQSYNDYMAGLNDVIPDLYKLAYSMWQDDADYTRENVGLLQSLESGDYEKYLNELNQWNNNRNFDYNAYRDSVSDARYADETAYERARYADQTAYDRNRDALNDSRYNDENGYSKLVELAKLGAQYGDYQGLERLGISPTLQTTATNTGRQYTGGSNPTRDTSDAGGSKWSEVEAYAAIGGDPETYIKANYKNLGFSSQSAAIAAWEVYNTENKAAGKENYYNSTTRNQLASLDYDEDEGVFTWNGKRYSSVRGLENDLNSYVENGQITPEIESELKRKLNAYGFDV